MEKTQKKSISKKKSSSKASSGKTSAVGNHDSMLKKFFHKSLKDIYWAEKHLVKALPKLRKAATSEELRNALDEHLEITKTQVERLEEVFETLGYPPQAKKCEAMEGLTREAETIIDETESGTATRDVGIIIAAQKVEHYEIASYGGLAQLARTLGHDDIADTLGATLAEEKEADEILTSIAESNINQEANTENGEEEEE